MPKFTHTYEHSHPYVDMNIPTYLNTHIIRKVKAYVIVIELIKNSQVKSSSDL